MNILTYESRVITSANAQDTPPPAQNAVPPAGGLTPPTPKPRTPRVSFKHGKIRVTVIGTQKVRVSQADGAMTLVLLDTTAPPS